MNKQRLIKQISDGFDRQFKDAVRPIKLISFDVNSLVTEYKSRGLSSDYEADDVINSAELPEAITVLCLQNELKMKPAIDDNLVIENIKYQVLNVQTDPFNVTWSITCLK